MNTITTSSFRSLIARLFADAQTADAPLRASVAALSAEERAAFMKTADYKAFYGRAKDAYLAVSEETGTLLYLLARSSGARAIVEFGTSFGISTLHLAAALKDNGGGRLIGSELEASKAERARENLKTVAGMASQLNSAVGTSVEFPGRIIAALVRDPEVMKRSGGTFIAAELAQEYGITDIDGRVIPSLRAERGAPIWMPV